MNNLNNNNSANEDTNEYFGASGISALSFGGGPVARGATAQQTNFDSMANIDPMGMGQMGQMGQMGMVHQ